jgi:hypothetical protein|tara:strand:- start:758 stop:1111 length:354 start_codon:yes stop_codon:yes gene_type:complete
MAASVHNFILTWNELNIIQGLLRDSYENTTDENSRNSTKALMDKLVEQLYSGYPASEYPFWRNYFEDGGLKDVTITNEQVYEYLGGESGVDGDAIEIIANLASGTFTVENLQKDILE